MEIKLTRWIAFAEGVRQCLLLSVDVPADKNSDLTLSYNSVQT